MTQHLGEIIEANTTGFIARCAVLHEPPAFGAFVKVSAAPQPGEDPFAAASFADGAIYALVAEATTTGTDPGRRPAAFGLTEDELRRDQPQVFELLATDFTAITIGHAACGAVRCYLPPRPPRIHQRVWPCGDAEVAALTGNPGYLRAILSRAPLGLCEELIAAAIRCALEARGGDVDFLVGAGKLVAQLLRDDFDRLHAVLSKLPPLPG